MVVARLSKMHTPGPCQRGKWQTEQARVRQMQHRNKKKDESTDVWQENLSQNNKKAITPEGANGSLWSALPHSTLISKLCCIIVGNVSRARRIWQRI